MPDAELSSLSSTLDEIRKRVATKAETVEHDDPDLAVDLYEIERSLSMALRRLNKLLTK
jgi:hypothetical protein